MKGESMTVGSGKTLKSGPEDNVFFFYDDHGNYNILSFPVGGSMNSSHVQDVIDTMVSKKMFKNFIIYIEACFSGSVFYKLNLPSNVYVVTAAPVGASSYAGCFNRQLNTYVCDLMAHAWITDMEKEHKHDRTFKDLYEVIDKALTHGSQGCRYGDMSMEQLTLDGYFYPSFSSRNVNSVKDVNSFNFSDVVSNFDVEVEVARRVYQSNRTKENFNKLKKEILIRNKVDDMGAAIVAAALPKSLHLASTPCKVCDDTCQCIIQCKESHSEERCKFECCNEESCYKDPPSMVNNAEFERRESCILTLSEAYSQSCGKNANHPYLLSTGLLFHRICKQQNANIPKALEEINRQCSSFNIDAL